MASENETGQEAGEEQREERKEERKEEQREELENVSETPESTNEPEAHAGNDAQAAAAAGNTEAEVSEPAAAETPEVAAPARSRSSTRKNPRTLTGTVVSDRMDKTISVLVERSVKHPIYGKIIRRKSRIHAHDERNECKVGDFVTIVESRPISKRKSWRLQSLGTVNDTGNAEAVK